MGGGDHRPHVGVGLGAVGDGQAGHPVGDPADQVVADRVDGDDHRDGHAALAGRAVAGAHRGVGRGVEVGVGQHDHVVLGAAESLHPLAGLCRGLVDVAGDRGGADEAHAVDAGVLEQRVDGFLVALHHVEHAVGQPSFGPQLGHQQ